MAIVAVAAWALQATGDDAPQPVADSPLAAALDKLHADATEARKARDFTAVEALRKQRLALLRDAKAESPWTAGHAAITAARDLVRQMKYEEACATLSAAWAPFERTARDGAVFGDVALELFAASEAAKAVYPGFNAVSADRMRAAVQKAAEADPCQVEALVATAFLTPPAPTEAFAPAPLRTSLQTRNKLLVKALPGVNHFATPLPWHAPAELLKAENNSFVLGDLDFYQLFLDPTRPLRGVDRDGQPVHVVMGGGLLTTERDATGTRRLVVYDFDAATGGWVRMTPRILRVQPAMSKPTTWRINEEQLNADLRGIMDDAIAERQTLIKRRLLVSAEGLQASIRVKADIRKIFAYLQDPPKNTGPVAFDQVFGAVLNGYSHYALVNPDEAAKVTAAQQQVQQLAEEWNQFKAGVEALRVSIGDLNNGGQVQPEKAATALADFLKAIGVGSADVRELADIAADEPAATAKEQPATKKPTTKKLDAAAPIQLTGQELRAKMSRQKEQYDLLALFKLMESVHRKAIDALVAPAAPAAVPNAAPPAPDDRAHSAARQRLVAALEQYDRAVTGRPAAKPAAAPPAGSAPTSLSLTLDELLDAQAAVREVQAALRTLGQDSDLTRFLGTFADTIEAVARPVAYEADMQRYCTKANRDRSWQVGRAIWRTYDFPATTQPQTVADIIEHCQRVAFATADFAAVMAQAVDDMPPVDAEIALRKGCTTPVRNRLVHDRSDGLALQFLSSVTDPCTVLLLDIDSSDATPARPAFLAAGDEPGLWIDIDGLRLATHVAADKKAKPLIVVKFAGPQGCVPLGAKADTASAARFMTDDRGNRIVRDRSPPASLLESHFYSMTSKAGDPITERSLNYALQDWLDLDRDIVNVFLPNAMRLAPALPVWNRYRREFMRPAPDTGWMWPAPQPPVAATSPAGPL